MPWETPGFYMQTDILFPRFLKTHKNFLKLRARLPKLYQVFITFKDQAHSVKFGILGIQLGIRKKNYIFQQKS